MSEPESVRVSLMAVEFPVVYDELRALAGRYLRGRTAGHTLQPTALVHEVYLKMQGCDGLPADRAHFLAVAATAMRQILIDHARRKDASKRGGDQQRVTVTIDRAEVADGTEPVDLLQLDELLGQLEQTNAMQAKIVELRLFGGLTIPEIADALHASVRTIERHWRFARAWLRRHME
jgi:RNA polymerase sigma-70 factor, ECF subfamily